MYVLLIPDWSADVSPDEIQSKYGEGVEEFISNAQYQHKSSVDIALVGNESTSKLASIPRGQSFAYIQPAINQLYSLIASILVRQDSESESSENDLDVRVYITYPDPEKKPSDQALGPFLPFSDFATAPRPWTDVYTWDVPTVHGILKRFAECRISSPTVFNPPCVSHTLSSTVKATALSVDPPTKDLSHQDSSSHKLHHSIAVGGTFDHLHLGHKLLLTATALVLDPPPQPSTNTTTHPRTLTIGITTTSLLVNKAHASVLEDWDSRQTAVINFLAPLLWPSIPPPTNENNSSDISNNDSYRDNGTLKTKAYTSDAEFGTAVHYSHPDSDLTVRCVEIADAYGPTITDENIDALVVSAETRKGGEAVNGKRVEKGWAALDVYEVGVLDGGGAAAGIGDGDGKESESKFQSKISSTEIRRRLVERREKGAAS